METVRVEPMQLPHLTTRENQVALLCIDYYPRKEIARRLGISYSNVGVLMFRIRAKLRASCMAEMVVILRPWREKLEHPVVIP
jgi:DNA-binding CsgD family transcriptional regulator